MIQKYSFNTYLSEFVVVALLKHASRFLSECSGNNVQKIDIGGFSKTGKEKLMASLFDNIEIPIQISNFQIGKAQKKLKTKTFFVYRDPFEAFCSSISQAAMINGKDGKPLWDGNKSNVNPLIAGSGHFCFHIWRDVLSMVNETGCEDILFIELKDLSDFLVLETLQHFEHNKKRNEESNIVGLMEKGIQSKEELIEVCKVGNPILWEKYVEQINLDRIALDTLLEKYKWSNPIIPLVIISDIPSPTTKRKVKKYNINE
jgi:hypothetical protein